MKTKTIIVAVLSALATCALLAEDLVVGDEAIEFTEGDRTYDSLKMASGANNYNSRLYVSGGSFTVTGTTQLNGTRNRTKSTLAFYGDVTASLNALTLNGSDSFSEGYAYWTVSNDAQVTFGNYSARSCNGPNYQTLLFADDCRVIQNDGCTFNQATPGAASKIGNYTTIRDNAYVDFDQFTIGFQSAYANIDPGYFRVTDHATLVIRRQGGTSDNFCPNTVGGSWTYDGVTHLMTNALDISGHALLYLKGRLAIGSNPSGGVRVREHGRIVVPSTGMILFGWNGSNHGLLDITDDAQVISTNKLVFFRGYQDASVQATILLRNGGTLECPGFKHGLLVTSNPEYGIKNLVCEGGTLRPNAANNEFLRYFATVSLAGAGLTLDTAGYATGICQAFTGTTLTKAGEGVLTVNLASTHATTALAGGTLLFATGASSFGNHLVVTNGATVSTSGASTGFSAEELTLGDATSAGILNVDAGDTVMVASAAGLHFVNGKINHPNAGTDGTYDIFTVTSGVPTEEQLAGLSVYTKSLGKKYKFAAVADGDGAKVQLTVSTVTIVEDGWSGAVDGAWRTPGNWLSGAYADEYTIATFPASATRKAVTIANADAANEMILEDSYAFTGAGSLTVGAIDVKAGASTVDVALNVASSLPIANPAGTDLALGGALTGTEAVMVTKTGAGVMTVSGDNAGYDGAWTADGGYLVFDGDTAAGSADETTATWQLGGGTVVFTNGTQTIGRAVTMDPGTMTGMVVDAEGDTTIIGGLNSVSGGYVQRGAGRLTLHYGLGTKRLGANVMGGMPSGAVTFPADGSTPVSSCLAAVNVLSGTLRLVGQGETDTTWSETSFGVIVGGNWAEAPVSARLEVTKGTLSNEGDKSVAVGSNVSSPNANRPSLSVGAGGVVSSSRTAVGRGTVGFDGEVYPTLAVTNGSATSFYEASFGIDSATSRIHPVVRVGTGGSVVQRAGVGRLIHTGILVGHDVDVEVADGGYISANKRNWGLFVQPAASGEMRFVNGGKLSVPFISSTSAATATDPLKFVFDGGVYSPLIAHTTSVHNAAIRYIELRNGGMTFTASVDHTLAMRLTGSGDFTKTGTGALTFPAQNECVYHSGSSTEDDHTPNDDYIVLGDSGYRTLDFTGTLYVSAGAVVIEPGAARTGLRVEVASGASVGFAGGAADAPVVRGAGTVRNATGGRLTLVAKSGATPTLSNLKLDVLMVDFSVCGMLQKGDTVTVAKLTDGSTVGRFKALNVSGDTLSASFATDGEGNVVATVTYKNGLSVIVR